MCTIYPGAVRKLVAQLKLLVQSLRLGTDVHRIRFVHELDRGSEFLLMLGASPEIRALVCERCWSGPFSKKSFKKFVSGKVVFYTTRWSHVQTAAECGCGMCGLLISEKDEENFKEKVTFRLTFCRFAAAIPGGPHAGSPPGAQFLRIEVEGYEIVIDNDAYYFHTAPGGYVHLDLMIYTPYNSCFKVTPPQDKLWLETRSVTWVH